MDILIKLSKLDEYQFARIGIFCQNAPKFVSCVRPCLSVLYIYIYIIFIVINYCVTKRYEL